MRPVRSLPSRAVRYNQRMTYREPKYRFDSELQAEDILKDRQCAMQYQRGMGFFHTELAHLSATLYLIDRFSEFPWDVFRLPSGGSYLFRVVNVNLLESATLTVVKLYNDASGHAYDLRRFKNEVMNELIKDEYKDVLRQTLGEVRFDQEVEEGFERAKQLRNNVVAHFSRQWHELGRTSEQPEEANITVELSELRDMRDALESLYMALALGTRRSGLPLEYDPPIYARPSSARLEDYLREDADFLLNSIAARSPLWDRPEDSIQALAQLSNEKIAKLDAYRQGFGKPRLALTTEQYDEINRNAGWGREPKLPPIYLAEPEHRVKGS